MIWNKITKQPQRFDYCSIIGFSYALQAAAFREWSFIKNNNDDLRAILGHSYAWSEKKMCFYCLDTEMDMPQDAQKSIDQHSVHIPLIPHLCLSRLPCTVMTYYIITLHAQLPRICRFWRQRCEKKGSFLKKRRARRMISLSLCKHVHM